MQVKINGVPAPLLFVSAEQINFQAPFGLAGSTVEIQIITAAGASDPVTAPLISAQPGIFFDPVTGVGAIRNDDDGTFIIDRPARTGDSVQVFCTGLGEVVPPGQTGLPAPLSPVSVTTRTPQVLIGGRDAAVAFSRLAPFLAGVYAIAVQVPEDLPPGRHTLIVIVEGIMSNSVWIDVQ